MRTEDSTVPELMSTLEAGHDEAREFEQLEQLAEHASDPALRRELQESVASGRATSRGFRKAWDRFWMGFVYGR